MPARDPLTARAPIRRALLRWFRRWARPLPWRKAKDPYAIWVSEVMLQQTQVASVIPYYRRFLHAFPNVTRLARARRERVLALWSGLGYYSRTRHLHQAARVVTERFAGAFPRQYTQARALPGVGDYTARAILSIAYNQPYHVLDGNVARVLARLGARPGSLNQPAFRRAAERDLDRLLSRQKPGDFNQALMELGQTVCLPRAPRCPACVLRTWCRAYRLGKQDSFPSPRPRRPAETRYLAAAVARRDHKVLMVRGLDEGLLGDLWNFPSAFGKSRPEALTRLRKKLAGLGRGQIRLGKSLGELGHGITYRTIRVHLYSTSLPGGLSQNSARWVPLDRLTASAVSQLARKIARKL